MELKSQEQLTKELTAPLPPEAIKPHPTKTYLSSIKAIYVTERLSTVFGIGGWKLKTDVVKEGEKGMIVVKSILEVPAYDIYLESFGGNDNGGENSKNFDLGDAYKGATTDAITKIGSYLGIGIDVFKGKVSAPQSKAPTTPQAPTTQPVVHPELVPGTDRWLKCKEALATKLATLAKIKEKNTITEVNQALLLKEAKILEEENAKKQNL